jgi:hypothetical protein
MHQKVYFFEVSSGGYAAFRAEISQRFDIGIDNFTMYFLFDADDFDSRRKIANNASLDSFKQLSSESRCEKYVFDYDYDS